jgi:hypothetical protein
MSELVKPIVVAARYLQAEMDLEAQTEFNAKLAKLFQKLKKDAAASGVRGGYKGTGSKKYSRQIDIHFKSGAFLDIFLEKGYLQFGGVMMQNSNGERDRRESNPLPRGVAYTNKTAEEVYEEAAKLLNAWANPAT